MVQVRVARVERNRVGAVLVVVPARDEQELIPACLDALAIAASRTVPPVLTVVVLDACVDRTFEGVSRHRSVVMAECDAACVGAARALGVTRGLGLLASTGLVPDVANVWIACTDADSRVPPDWLSHQVALAEEGADLVLGTVNLRDAGLRPGSSGAWRDAYRLGVGDVDHRHVHGANLGVRASSYAEAGGFRPVGTHEDVLLARAVARLPGTRVRTTLTVPVSTSSRTRGRARGGVADDLLRLDQLGNGVATY